MVTSASAAKGAPKLITVKVTRDGVEHTQQIDAATREKWDEASIDYAVVSSPMTGLEHLPEPIPGGPTVPPTNKAGQPATK